MNLRCLIIDDEQPAREMLQAYVQKTGGIQLVGSVASAAAAERILSEEHVDLLLLDINMPRKNGIELVQSRTKVPMIIFTTAFAEYAIAGFELQVLDYLLKPIGFDRFQQAIQKAISRQETEHKAHAFDQEQVFDQQYLMVKEGYNHHKVFLRDIIYVTAMREYVNYMTEEGKYLELRPISVLAKELPSAYFLRIHRSFLVARSAVIGQNGNQLLLEGGYQLPIGKTYKQKVLHELFYDESN